MSRHDTDSTTYFRGTNFSYHEPYILDPGGSADTAVPKFMQAPAGAFLQGSKKIQIYLILMIEFPQ
jgi:hypothetical protein